jgi:hypothetical protein
MTPHDVMAAHRHDEVILACAHLVEHAGAKRLDIGYVHDGVPSTEAGWYAIAYYGGARIFVENHASPVDAAMALSVRLLTGAICKCGAAVSLTDSEEGCRWRLGQRWTSGCEAPPVHTPGARGDYEAMRHAYADRMRQEGKS